MSEMNIYQRLNKVRQDVTYLQKDANVQGYKAITHDAVTSAIREPFIEHGIMVVPDQTKSNLKEAGETSNGTIIIRYEAWYEVKFINIDNPEDCFSLNIEAHAMDHGDKAPGKSISYAEKYALLKVLNIETGESEESRIEIKRKEENKKLVPDSDRWELAVKAVAEGKTTVEKIKKSLEITEKDEAKFKKEVLELNNAEN